MSKSAGWRVLNLGAARTANLDFFSRYGQLTIADFYRGVRPLRGSFPANRKRNAFEKVFDFDTDARFDLILAWDLLNYLTPEEHQLLLGTLEPFLVPGASILALVSMQKKIPREPSHYWIKNEKTVAYETPEEGTRPCPRYLENDLLKRMPSLTVESRYHPTYGPCRKPASRTEPSAPPPPLPSVVDGAR